MKKILVIDDEEDFCDFLKTNLELRGDYEVISAFSGKEGIVLAGSERPDLILLDIIMPYMNGFEVLKRLRKEDGIKNIPVIMVTARGDDEAMIKALRLHDDGFIIKPVKLEELEGKIEDLLGKQKDVG